MKVVEVDVSRGAEQLAGATAGQAIYRELLAPLAADRNGGDVAILGFRGAAWVTGSIFKATWLELQEQAPDLPVAVAYLSEDARHEFSVCCKGFRRPGVEARDWTESGITAAVVHGPMEDASYRTLELLIAHPGSTAPELHELSGSDRQPTAWTNRLNELWRRGLALRERAGRAWRFYPVMKEVSRG